MNRKVCFFALFFCAASYCGTAQPLHNPLDLPPVLSGNFGEFRANHLHSGIDFKTQGREGKPVRAVQDGYVSRIVVSPWGYGNAIYLTHPDDSIITVYAHLQRFADELARYVKTQQYAAERFQIDLSFTPGRFVFKQGDIIGYSGNSGSSAGPHLHYEIRDTRTGETLDPLPFHETGIKDTRPPKLHSLMICPAEGLGVVNGTPKKHILQPVTDKSGNIALKEKIEAWGRIGFAVHANDYMDNTHNVYGIKEIVMSVDDEEVFRSHLDRFSFDESRYINAWIDYETWIAQKKFYTKTFVEQGNHLQFIAAQNRGFVTINEARTYTIRFLLTDGAGNTSAYTVHVTGKEQAIPAPDTEGRVPFYYRGDNRFATKGIRLLVPDGGVYRHFYFRYEAQDHPVLQTPVHVLHDKPVALHRPAQLSLRLQRDDADNKQQYGIVRLQNGQLNWMGGVYRDGWIDIEISELGSYAVDVDSVAPQITAVDSAYWTASQTIAFRITDNLSGVHAWHATIDGAYALFALDGKRNLISCAFDPERHKRGKHTLQLAVSDTCGNKSVYETTFEW